MKVAQSGKLFAREVTNGLRRVDVGADAAGSRMLGAVHALIRRAALVVLLALSLASFPNSAARTATPAAAAGSGDERTGNWAQWRGPGGSGVSSETGLPTEWAPAAGSTPAINIRWKAEIPGRGHSSPIIWGDRIFLTTSFKGELVPGRK